MQKKQLTQRRQFLQSAGIATCAAGLLATTGIADETVSAKKTGWLRKTLKVGMIKANGLEQKFKIALQAGFEGVELNVPGVKIDEAVAAAKKTGIVIDGTVGNYHWKIRHTDPSADTRAEALKRLIGGIEETAKLGGTSMLLVPGHGKDGSDAEVYERAVTAVKQALPTAEKHKIQILIENVWNDFCFDQEGGSDQTAERLAKFIDEFKSPLVGVQYDIGNHWKYGDPAEWIRTLGDRIKKLDIKGFSRASGKFTKITEGDIKWPEVEKALRDIKFTGWLAAEVGGGSLDRLREVNDHLEQALHCSKS